MLSFEATVCNAMALQTARREKRIKCRMIAGIASAHDQRILISRNGGIHSDLQRIRR